MSNITNTGASEYAIGAIDTATVLENGVSPRRAEHVNGPASAVVQIETVLGVGTDLKGTQADLATRLAVGHNPNGSHKLLTVAEGGTGSGSHSAGAVLAGNGSGALLTSGVGVQSRVLASNGSSAPSWLAGLLFHGPTSMGASSSNAGNFGSSLTNLSTATMNGIHFYHSVTLLVGQTLTLGANGRRLILVANDTITINGTINASGAGGAGGAGNAGAAGSAGGSGTDQAAGGGGASGAAGGSGGSVLVNGVTLLAGGGSGSSASQLTGSSLPIPLFFDAMGGAGGGGGGGGGGGADTGGTGGAGGGSIVLIAPTVVLASTATLNTSGSSGGVVALNGTGGGGGAGNVYIICRSYTNNGATFTLTGGGGGSNGATGVRQILIYG